MKILKCVGVERDKNNKIEQYILEDTHGQKVKITPSKLKTILLEHQACIVNMSIAPVSERLTINTKSLANVDIDKLGEIVQEHYPFVVYNLGYNDGAVNFNENGTLYYVADVGIPGEGKVIGTEFWFNYIESTACVLLEYKGYPKYETHAKAFTEKGIEDMISRYLKKIAKLK